MKQRFKKTIFIIFLFLIQNVSWCNETQLNKEPICQEPKETCCLFSIGSVAAVTGTKCCFYGKSAASCTTSICCYCASVGCCCVSCSACAALACMKCVKGQEFAGNLFNAVIKKQPRAFKK